MTNHMIDKLLFLVFFVVIATTLYYFYPYSNPRVKEASESETDALAHAQPVAVQQQIEFDPAFAEREEIVASPLIVRHLTDKATLLVRYRATKQACTAHLIIWSGAKRKSISDSYYDLGVIKDVAATDETVEQFMAIANERLIELAQAGKRKRKAVQEAKQEVVEATEAVESAPVEIMAAQPEQVVVVPPSIDVEDTPPESIKLKRFPSVYRGIITEVGMMRQNKGDREFDTFGVRYTTQEGVVEAVFGANLRAALKEAKVDVGDHVEILKIGRKTIDKGKAPMNLFKVAKLGQPTA